MAHIEPYLTYPLNTVLRKIKASHVAHWVKNPPAIQETQETWVQSLSQEDPLKKKMATHSSILAWKCPWTEEPSGLQSMDRKELDTTE